MSDIYVKENFLSHWRSLRAPIHYSSNRENSLNAKVAKVAKDRELQKPKALTQRSQRTQRYAEDCNRRDNSQLQLRTATDLGELLSA
jgi:hypothetical protein